MACVGKVHDLTAEFHFEWRIDDFFSLPEKDGICCTSPPFSFDGESWCLAIYPNGRSVGYIVGYIGVYLRRILNGQPINLTWSFGVKTFEGKTDRVKQYTKVFEKAAPRWGCPKFLKKSDLSAQKSELVPSDVLTLVCHIELYSKSSDGADEMFSAKNAGEILEHQQQLIEKNNRMRFITATKKLLEDLEDIFESEEHSDVTIRVKDEEFRLHRNILGGRNRYFSSMFKTEMKEKNTGIVSINDCKPDIFVVFVKFLYTGRVHTLSCDNVCAVYEVADKYQEDQLKAECLCYMKNEISVDSFVDFIVLALKHDEEELLQTATDLFCRKIKEIIQSVKCQTFMQEYPFQANELHIQAVNYYVK